MPSRNTIHPDCGNDCLGPDGHGEGCWLHCHCFARRLDDDYIAESETAQ